MNAQQEYGLTDAMGLVNASSQQQLEPMRQSNQSLKMVKNYNLQQQMRLLTSGLMTVNDHGKQSKSMSQQQLDTSKVHIKLAAQPTLFSLKKTQNKTYGISKESIPTKQLQTQDGHRNLKDGLIIRKILSNHQNGKFN